MDVAPDFGFVLMEHARRVDELPRIETALRDLGQAVVPVRAPGQHPSGRVKAVSDSESDWDFFDDPDPAAEAEWLDARWVFDFCDGVTSIEGLGDATMLGRFRTLAAVLAPLALVLLSVNVRQSESASWPATAVARSVNVVALGATEKSTE